MFAHCPRLTCAAIARRIAAIDSEMREVEESMVGLALLHDLPNYRHSMPTKILEYMASGAAVVATPLPLSRQVIGDDGVVLDGFTDIARAAADAVIRLCDDDARRTRLTHAAFECVSAHYNWNLAQASFVDAIKHGTPQATR
jgi:glycosyltransferase involved in cell wall biosynthesis